MPTCVQGAWLAWAGCVRAQLGGRVRAWMEWDGMVGGVCALIGVGWRPGVGVVGVCVCGEGGGGPSDMCEQHMWSNHSKLCSRQLGKSCRLFATSFRLFFPRSTPALSEVRGHRQFQRANH